MRQGKRWLRLSLLSCLGALFIWLSALFPSTAHWADLAVADVMVGKTQTDITLTLPTGLIAFADEDKSGQLSNQEIQQHQSEIQAFVGDRIQLRSGDRRFGHLSVVAATAPIPSAKGQGAPGQHSTLQLQYTWQQPVTDLTMSYRLFIPGVQSARCLATILENGLENGLENATTRTVVFTPEQPEFSLQSTPVLQQLAGFVGLGIEHILTGYDHILFLVSLLMLGGGLSYLLKVVTAFTVSHSITLSLAVLGVVNFPGQWVESLIALTIVYVAAENFWRKTTQGRWMLTFAFGLIHGFGFASILQEMDIPRSQLALALGGFNLGVELGQIFAVTLIFAGLTVLRHRPWLKPFRQWISAGVIVMGLIWFAERTFGAA